MTLAVAQTVSHVLAAELEREWEWTKHVEPSETQDPFSDWPRHH